ncbi:hypothetical protein [Candidatus Nitrosotenuis chungbukensis]|uniref:hypothetical protein n=1 Tax=Candidatus Nitrosotenuis chungbukensis TaxID=1353246 RepID=UPI0005B2AEC8|nr:hypothetical protein [Candidatus Nitrosotenuis chungbukensis]
MQTSLLLSGKKPLASLLAIVAFAMMAANYFGEEHAVLTSSFLNLAITVPLVVVSVALLIKDGTKGSFGKAWVFFASFIILWFVAERIWMVDELVYRQNPFPSAADFFWLAGYPIYFVFAFFYLRTFKSSISIRLTVSVICLTITMAGFLAYYSGLQESDLPVFDTLLGLVYPIADTLSLAPIIIGLILFFRGDVSFLWSCLLFGMLCFVVADYGFFFLSLDESYRTGHPIDILYLWAYLFFLSGSCNYVRIFKKRNQDNRFDDQADLR